MHFDEDPFICQREKEDEKAERFQISHFSWWFSNDIMIIMAVKGHSVFLFVHHLL